MTRDKKTPKEYSPLVPDMELWRDVTTSVRPAGWSKKKSIPKKQDPVKTLPQSSHRVREHIPTGTIKKLDLDQGVTRALKQKKFSLDARLDLHGMTQEQAHHALVGFIHQALARQYRTLLIITGKGSAGKGTLKTQTPLWIETHFARHVLGMTEAPVDLGGSGALLLRLRKN